MADLISGATSIAGAAIAWMLYRLNKTQQRESWPKTYKEVHEAFWNDPVMAEIRSWIACEQAYLDVKPILQKRRAIKEHKLAPNALEKSEYVVIDKLDKFLNFVLRISAINLQLRSDYGQNMWKALFVEYWLMEAMQDNRTELRWYIETFFPELLNPKILQVKLKESEMRSKIG